MQMSFHPRVWINPIVSALWPIENEMFLAAILREEGIVAEQLRSQFADFNFARRHQQGREVFFFRIDFGIFRSSREAKVDVSRRELPWVEFVLKLKSGANLKAKFHLLNGTACYIRYSGKANRNAVDGATITKMERFSWDETAIAERNPLNVLGLAEELKELSSGDDLDAAFPQFMSPEETYEIALAQGDFVAIGELPQVGMIMALLNSDSLSRGIYIGRYDDGEVEFVAEDLEEAVKKLRSGAAASAP
jgi:hypothetical protein